jgi:periplasmic protein TonB
MKITHTTAGGGISLLIHAMILSLMLLTGKFISSAVQPMVIDFSISSAKPVASQVALNKGPVEKRIASPKPFKKPVEKKIVQRVVPKPPPKKVVEKKEPEPVKPIPEPIKVVKKETPEPLPEEMVAVAPEEKVSALPEPVQAETARVATANDDAPDDGQPQVAQAGGGQEASAGPAGDGNASGPIDPRARYIKAHYEYIKNDIQNTLIYPIIARKKGWQGTVIVSFVVSKDGMVQEVQIKESSGFSILDQSAVNTIKKAAPFPPPPARAELIVPINYSLV